MSAVAYTKKGLEALGTIVRATRGDRTYREFEADVAKILEEHGVDGRISHGTIRRVEIGDLKSPDYNTLAKLAWATSYTLEELQAIMSERDPFQVERQYRVAEDLYPLVNQLSEVEAGKLARYIIESRLIRQHKSAGSAHLQDNP